MKLLTQPGAGSTDLVEAINSAVKSIEIVIFRFDRREIEAALKAAAARGVFVHALGYLPQPRRGEEFAKARNAPIGSRRNGGAYFKRSPSVSRQVPDQGPRKSSSSYPSTSLLSTSITAEASHWYRRTHPWFRKPDVSSRQIVRGNHSRRRRTLWW